MMPDTEELSAGRSPETALNDPDELNLLQEFAEQKRKERENDPEVKRVKNKYKLKAPKYPSPGNILHTGRQLPRTPAPGVLPLLPSQRFEPIADEESFGFGADGAEDNMVPCGRQLPRTPTKTNVSREIPVKDDENCKGAEGDGDRNGAVICERNDEMCALSRVSDAMPEPVNSSSGGDIIAQKEVTSDAPSGPVMQNNRRISEMPVQGLHQMRISGVLEKLVGYECRSEDLDFLKHMENQEKAKGLKKELLCLRKDLAATNREKELVLAKKKKIEDDVEQMKLSLERTVQLGRGLLSRTQDQDGLLSPDEVLKQLNPMTIQKVHQQARLQLAVAEEELSGRRQEAADRTSLTDSRKRSLTLQVESSVQHIKETEYRVQQLKEEVITLKMQIKRTEENKLELEADVQKKRQQIGYCEMSEEEREKMNRKLQRILHRRDNYVERERILQRLKEELQ